MRQHTTGTRVGLSDRVGAAIHGVIFTVRLAAVAALVSGSACIPVHHVVGRSAAVVPIGHKEMSWGVSYVSWTELEYNPRFDDGPNDLGVLYVGGTLGLGRRTELGFGFNNLYAPFGHIRHQLLGPPAGVDPEDREGASPFDLSVELGASSSILQTDVSVGLHLSLPTRYVTPYVAVRHHYVTESDPDFQHTAGFFGLEFHGGTARRWRFSIEAFAGKSPSGHPDEPGGSTFETWGVNILFRRVEAAGIQ